jgi:flagellar protein FlbD
MMIRLHRLTHPEHAFHLNPDLIETVEATPDTIVTLGDGTKLVVIETPEDVVVRIREWKASVISLASLSRVHASTPA